MKIGLFVWTGVGSDGETNVMPCLLWLIERLVKAGDEVHVFTFQSDPAGAAWRLLGAQIHSAGRGHPRLSLFGQVLREHRRAGFDLFHAAWSPWGMAIAALLGRLLHVPALVYLGAGEPVALPDLGFGGQLTRTSRFWLHIAMIFADKIAAQSAYVVEQAAKIQIAAQRLPLGVAMDRWPVLAPRRRDPVRPARLLRVGHITPIKGHAMLLQMATHLIQMQVPFELDLVGQEVGERGQMQRRLVTGNLAPMLRFHGALPRASLRLLFEQADLLIVTSHYEAGPLVVFEAAMVGVPCVGTNVGHLAEWAPDAARVVATGAARALAENVAFLLAHEDERMALATEAQARAMLENADVTTAAFRRVYSEMAHR